MNQLIAVLQDVDMRLASGTDCRISHNYYSDKLRGGAMAASAHQPEDLIESNMATESQPAPCIWVQLWPFLLLRNKNELMRSRAVGIDKRQNGSAFIG